MANVEEEMTIIAAKALSGYMNRNNVFQRQQS
jgi:hypothetical protein